MMFICHNNFNVKNYCILDDSLKNIVNHLIEIHNASVSCEICGRKLETVYDIQQHAMVFTDADSESWIVYKQFFLSLYGKDGKQLYKPHDFSDDVLFDDCYTLQEFQHKFSNKICTDEKCFFDCNQNFLLDDESIIIGALNNYIKQMRNELQEEEMVSDQHRMNDVDDHATDVLNNVMGTRRGTYDLNFNNFSSSESLLEASTGSYHHPDTETASIGSIAANRNTTDSSLYRSISHPENSNNENPPNSRSSSGNTLQYYMTSPNTLLQAESEIHNLNSETSTITVLEGYHLEDTWDVLDDWDLYIQTFLYN